MRPKLKGGFQKNARQGLTLAISMILEGTKTFMLTPVAAVKMVPVDVSSFVAVGYVTPARQLGITFRNGTMLPCQNVPGVRYEGLAVPRKEAYFKTFIEHQFIAKPTPPPEQS